MAQAQAASAQIRDRGRSAGRAGSRPRTGELGECTSHGEAPEAGSTSVVDDLFVHLDRYLDWDGFLVVHSSDSVSALAAMKAASPRFSMVADSGTEFPRSQWETPAVANQLITSWVSEPKIEDGGVSIYIDTQGGITEGARDTFLRIISEELGRHGITSARVSEPPS